MNTALLPVEDIGALDELAAELSPSTSFIR